jgi:hypothetical protein
MAPRTRTRICFLGHGKASSGRRRASVAQAFEENIDLWCKEHPLALPCARDVEIIGSGLQHREHAHATEYTTQGCVRKKRLAVVDHTTAVDIKWIRQQLTTACCHWLLSDSDTCKHRQQEQRQTKTKTKRHFLRSVDRWASAGGRSLRTERGHGRCSSALQLQSAAARCRFAIDDQRRSHCAHSSFPGRPFVSRHCIRRIRSSVIQEERRLALTLLLCACGTHRR